MKKTILLLSLITLAVFSSCEKLKKDKDFDFEKDKYETKKDGDKEDCFELVYPITYTLPDGTTVTGENEESVWLAIKDWYEANPDVEAKPELNYPIDIIIDGTTQTINNEEEMITAKKDCPEEEIELCVWNESTEANGPEFEKIIVEELVYNADCDCIEKGFEKFLENGKTKFLIYYASKECQGYGYKVTCVDGNCEGAEKCKFLQACDEN